ncbi:MAG TPA: hypothetical protein VKW04_11950 [Planctomycetota bacterium]|jgi:hypothetical protein|nr:hypothetical protein [Planctomycetota bacterium]
MYRLAALPLALLSACGVHDLEFAAGATRTSPWYETDPIQKPREELTRTVRELITRCGYQAPEVAASANYFVTDWEVRMSAHWHDSFRSKLEIELVPLEKGGFTVRTRSWLEVNNNMFSPSDPNKAEWVGAGVDDRHKDRINEPALRFHSLLKFRIFGLNQ